MEAGVAVDMWGEPTDRRRSDVDGYSLADRTSPDGLEREIFQAHGVKLDLYGQDPASVLDAHSAESAAFIELLDGRGLRADIEEDLGMPPSELLIIHEARLAPAWRGLGGVGRLLTGRLINVIAPNALVALKPFP